MPFILSVLHYKLSDEIKNKKLKSCDVKKIKVFILQNDELQQKLTWTSMIQ
jgi:hypothetical protein